MSCTLQICFDALFDYYTRRTVITLTTVPEENMLSSLLYRLGRKLYTYARQEIGINTIPTNGEAVLQKQISTIFINESLVFFDVGANIGEWSISAMQQSTASKLTIHAFEPVAETNKVLSQAIKPYITPTTFILIRKMALSNAIGTQTIHLSGDLAGSNSLHGTPETTTTEEIQLTTLDQYCRDQAIDYIHFVKIDVEGHDMFALEGALTMLTTEKIAVVQFEYNHRWVFSRRYLKDVFDFQAAHLPAYQLGKLTDTGIIIYPRWHYELEKFFEGNYVLVHNIIVAKLSCRHVQFDDYNAIV